MPVLESANAAHDALTRREADALLALCERQRLPALTAGHRAVRFGHYCGVLQVGTLAVEILPKVSGANDAQDRATLLRMLALASRLPLGRLDADNLGVQRHTLLQVLVGWFCDELFRQFHQGLLRSYVRHEEPLSAVRGRWRPERDALRHPGRKDRLCCEYDELTANTAHHQLLKAALRRAAVLAHGSEALHLRTRELLGWLVEVDDVHVTVGALEQLHSNRLTRRYERALQMARWFLANESPDLREGPQHGLALLFDMNALFQASLATLLRSVMPDGHTLREDAPQRFLAHGTLSDRPHFQMRPDFCILRGSHVRTILDAKWKHLTPQAPDGRWGVTQADAYQLHAYARAYGCGRVTLCYPGPAGPADRPSFQFRTVADLADEPHLSLDWLALGASGQGSWLAGQRAQAAAMLQRALV